MQPAFFPISELAERVNAWCSEHGIEPANGQSGDLVSERNIRFYRTTGLVDAPVSGGSGYGEKHFLQLTAVRLLQAQGLPLRRIRELLFGRTTAELREIQRRGLTEANSLSAMRHLMPVADELWRMIPINDEFLIVSRRGATLSAEQRDAILRVLQPTPGPTQTTKPTL
jgi:DNA-binding transcriptional MerR regulator